MVSIKVFALFLCFTFGASVSAAPHINYTAASSCTVTEYSQVADAVSSCTELIIDGITVPAGTTLRLALKDDAKLTFQGHIRFEFAEWAGPLVLISGKGIYVQQTHGSYLDGNGHSYWDGKGGSGGVKKPLFFSIWSVTAGSEFRNIYLRNCPERCTAIDGVDSLTLDGWIIDNRAGMPGTAATGKESYNTDGFDIAATTNLLIENAIVYNQDDCVAINEGSSLKFNNLYCSGSHGLSLEVGLSTTDGSKNIVTDVVFSNCTLVDSMVGVHIGTMTTGATGGYIKNIYYENITLSGITLYGVSMEQNLLSNDPPLGNVPITNLQLHNVKGTMNGASGYSTGIRIVCGDGGCSDWTWSDVSVTGGASKDSCNFIPNGYSC